MSSRSTRPPRSAGCRLPQAHKRLLLGGVLLVSCLTLAGCRREPQATIGIGGPAEAVAAAKQRIETEVTIEATDQILIAAGARAIEGGFGSLRNVGALEPALQKKIADVLSTRLEAATRKVEAEIAACGKFVANEFEPNWRKLVEKRQSVSEDRIRFERDERKAQQTALALGTEHRWFWLASLIAVAALLTLFAADQRHEIRRYLNGGRAKGLGLGKALVAAVVALCVLTGSLFFASDGLLVDLLDRSGAMPSEGVLQREMASDTATVAELETRRSKQRQELEELHTKLEAEFTRQAPEAAGSNLFNAWWAYWQAATNRRVQVKALALSEARFTEAMTAVQDDATRIASARDSINTWRTRASRLTGFIGLGVLSFVALGVGLFARGVRTRLRKLANTCPMCLTEGKLQESDAADNGSGSGHRIAPGMVRCTHVISEAPFEECDFDFPSMFRAVPKLCFPTLGIPSAGKTHWLAMVYRELNRGNFPGNVEFAKIRSSSADDFDRIVEDILVAKVKPGATQVATIPKPIVFNFLDHDGLGRSNILVNIFDYSGEVFRRMTLEEHQRQRAFAADGYLFFLDPTQNSDLQFQPLVNFRQDVRVVKRLKAGQQIRCPVALCVPKIDLMPDEDYARGGNVVDRFYEELGSIGWGMDSNSIRQRSELMRNLRNTIWPGWEIERQIDDLFGGRYMFFPLTPVGLNEPGVKELSQRVISPLGILHPLMWLLHMNGYPVLNSRTTT